MKYTLVIVILILVVASAWAAKLSSIDSSTSLGATPIPMTASITAATGTIKGATLETDGYIRSNATAARVLWRFNY